MKNADSTIGIENTIGNLVANIKVDLIYSTIIFLKDF